MTALSTGALSLSLEDQAEAMQAYVDKLREIGARRRAERRGWISQRESDLGNRRHVREWRRLAAMGDPRAAKRGRDFLLAPGAVNEALAAMTKPKTRPEGAAERLRAQLGLVGGGRR